MTTSGQEQGKRRIAIAEGASREHLEELSQAFQSNGIDFEIEDQTTPEGGWRLLVAPSDALRARIALAAVLRRLRRGQGQTPAAGDEGPHTTARPGPLFEGNEGFWLRALLPLFFFGLALWLAVRALLG